MSSVTLKLEPLTREAFAPFGNVIEIDGARHYSINAGAIERYHDLALVDVSGGEPGRALISIAACNQSTSLPYSVPFVERHPLSSQAFIPFDEQPLVVVVALKGESVNPNELKAFISNGKQGINYHRGVWHMPLISLKQGQQLIIVDRGGPGNNCEEFWFTQEVIIER